MGYGAVQPASGQEQARVRNNVNRPASVPREQAEWQRAGSASARMRDAQRDMRRVDGPRETVQ